MSDIDDTADKLRRNLVVVSATILGASWLQFPVPSLLASIFNAGGTGESPAYRVWAAAGMLVLYLLGRFHFSDDRTELLKSLKAEHGRRLDAHIVVYAKRHEVAKRNHYIARKEKENSTAAASDGQLATRPKIMRRFGLQDLEFERTAHIGTSILFYRMEWSDDEPGEFVYRYPEPATQEDSTWDRYFPTRLQRVVALARSFIRSAIWSRGAFDVVAPYLLALGALCVCSAKFLSLA